MIKVKGSQDLIDALSGSNIQRIIETTIGRLTLKLLIKIKSEKLSGQVLNVQSGRLRRSMTQEVRGQGTNVVSGIVGTNVEYAPPHERGFHGVVSVKAHMREIKQAWGRSIAPRSVEVSGHSRSVNIPARSFLKSALNEMTPEIQASLMRAIDAGLKQ